MCRYETGWIFVAASLPLSKRDLKSAMPARVVRRIRAPLDHLTMTALDTNQVVNTFSTKNIAMLSWFVPVSFLRTGVHRRYEVKPFAEISRSELPYELPTPAPSAAADEDAQDDILRDDPDAPVQLGLVTMLLGQNVPSSQSFIERMLDPGPHSAMSLRITVEDRVHWQYTSWNHVSICKSIFWGKVPQGIYDIHLDYKNPVNIDATFDPSARVFTKYEASIAAHGLKIELEDTGIGMLDCSTPVVPGFLDNESAYKQLAAAREVNMRGMGGCVYRQSQWNTPTQPNVATIKTCEVDQFFVNMFGVPPVGPPVVSWLLDKVDETKVYQMEAQVESENDPSTATHFGDRSLHERVQKKAMNRFYGFSDNVRGKAYADMRGEEYQR